MCIYSKNVGFPPVTVYTCSSTLSMLSQYWHLGVPALLLHIFFTLKFLQLIFKFCRHLHLWCMRTAELVRVPLWSKVHLPIHHLRISVKVQEVPKLLVRIHIRSYRINLKFVMISNHLPTRKLFIFDGSPKGQRTLFIHLSIQKYEFIFFESTMHLLTPNCKTIKIYMWQKWNSWREMIFRINQHTLIGDSPVVSLTCIILYWLPL